MLSHSKAKYGVEAKIYQRFYICVAYIESLGYRISGYTRYTSKQCRRRRQRKHPAWCQRNFSCYNLSVYDMATKDAALYTWHEAVASRGSSEIASCVYNYLCELPKHFVLVLYSSYIFGIFRSALKWCFVVLAWIMWF